MSTITDLFAGVPVADLNAGIDWYTRFFGRPPDSRVGEEVLWEIDEHAWLFIEPNAAQAGAGRITFAVAGLDALLERLASEGIEHAPIETYSNGVRHVNVPDPDGNKISFAEPPDAASVSTLGWDCGFVRGELGRPNRGGAACLLVPSTSTLKRALGSRKSRRAGARRRGGVALAAVPGERLSGVGPRCRLAHRSRSATKRPGVLARPAHVP
jgi:catechol 2,3-dioxygenase-like lactoylglutathione lyase family enzyme